MTEPWKVRTATISDEGEARSAVMSLRTVVTDLSEGTLIRVPVAGAPLLRPLQAIWTGELVPSASRLLEVARTTG